jgi:hypothetical protein
MIRLLGDMPAGVIGLEAADDVEKEDYENVIVPAVNDAIAQHGRSALSMSSVRSSTITRERRSEST